MLVSYLPPLVTSLILLFFFYPVVFFDSREWEVCVMNDDERSSDHGAVRLVKTFNVVFFFFLRGCARKIFQTFHDDDLH